MPLEIDLTGRRAAVTGVTSGIGAGIARQLARAGCDVAGCGRRSAESDGAKAFLQLAGSTGRRVDYESVDLSHADSARAWIGRVAELWGGVDIVVSNAGRNVFRGVAEATESDWAECMDLDLAAHWRLAKAAKDPLHRSGAGVFLVITSNHAFSSIPGCFPYNVAKAGLVALVQSLAIEWGPAVRAVGIAPGFIDTPGNDTWFESFSDPNAERRRTERLHPVGRLGSCEELGALCAFLATEHAGFVSGTTIVVDGGRSALMQDPPKRS